MSPLLAFCVVASLIVFHTVPVISYHPDFTWKNAASDLQLPIYLHHIHIQILYTFHNSLPLFTNQNDRTP